MYTLHGRTRTEAKIFATTCLIVGLGMAYFGWGSWQNPTLKMTSHVGYWTFTLIFLVLGVEFVSALLNKKE